MRGIDESMAGMASMDTPVLAMVCSKVSVLGINESIQGV